MRTRIKSKTATPLDLPRWNLEKTTKEERGEKRRKGAGKTLNGLKQFEWSRKERRVGGFDYGNPSERFSRTDPLMETHSVS